MVNLFNIPAHHWLKDHKNILVSFKILESYLHKVPAKGLKFLFEDHQLSFHKCGQNYAMAIPRQSSELIILVFPDLYKRLLSKNHLESCAILTHEIGHLLFKHRERGISQIKAQLEADEFTWALGLGPSLLKVLKGFHSKEAKIRRSALLSLK